MTKNKVEIEESRCTLSGQQHVKISNDLQYTVHRDYFREGYVSVHKMTTDFRSVLILSTFKHHNVENRPVKVAEQKYIFTNSHFNLITHEPLPMLRVKFTTCEMDENRRPQNRSESFA